MLIRFIENCIKQEKKIKLEFLKKSDYSCVFYDLSFSSYFFFLFFILFLYFLFIINIHWYLLLYFLGNNNFVISHCAKWKMPFRRISATLIQIDHSLVNYEVRIDHISRSLNYNCSIIFRFYKAILFFFYSLLLFFYIKKIFFISKNIYIYILYIHIYRFLLHIFLFYKDYEFFLEQRSVYSIFYI